jgi:hypothetical protein
MRADSGRLFACVTKDQTAHIRTDAHGITRIAYPYWYSRDIPAGQRSRAEHAPDTGKQFLHDD